MNFSKQTRKKQTIKQTNATMEIQAFLSDYLFILFVCDLLTANTALSIALLPSKARYDSLRVIHSSFTPQL